MPAVCHPPLSVRSHFKKVLPQCCNFQRRSQRSDVQSSTYRRQRSNASSSLEEESTVRRCRSTDFQEETEIRPPNLHLETGSDDPAVTLAQNCCCCFSLVEAVADPIPPLCFHLSRHFFKIFENGNGKGKRKKGKREKGKKGKREKGKRKEGRGEKGKKGKKGNKKTRGKKEKRNKKKLQGEKK